LIFAPSGKKKGKGSSERGGGGGATTTWGGLREKGGGGAVESGKKKGCYCLRWAAPKSRKEKVQQEGGTAWLYQEELHE